MIYQIELKSGVHLQTCEDAYANVGPAGELTISNARGDMKCFAPGEWKSLQSSPPDDAIAEGEL